MTTMPCTSLRGLVGDVAYYGLDYLPDEFTLRGFVSVHIQWILFDLCSLILGDRAERCAEV